MRWYRLPPRPPALLPAPSSSRLLAASEARLDIVALRTQVLENPRPLDFAAEDFQGPLKRVVLFDDDLCHITSRPKRCPYEMRVRAMPSNGWDGPARSPMFVAQPSSLVTFSAAGPLVPCTTSNSTASPSRRVLKPSP